MSSDTLMWLRWALIPNLGVKRSHTLLNLIDSPHALFRHPDRWPLPESIVTTLREMNTLGEQHPIHRRALDQIHWANQDNHCLITIDDDHYPESLSHLHDAPIVLWGDGNPALLNTAQVAIVGSRQASPNALRHTKKICKELSASGLTITSGGALGIDRACHQATLEQQGSTIAVLGCGIDVIYPKSNASLFFNIRQQGLLLSEYPLGTQPKPGHFPRRNRLISGLSSVVVVIEAALKSGSLVTAQHALEQGKDIFAMPGDIGNPNTGGCHQLIQDGANLLTGASDILKHLQWIDARSGHDSTPSAPYYDHLTPLQNQIIEQLRFSQLPLDSLGHHLGVGIHQLLEPILVLELEGIIEQHPGGYTLSDID